jgi:hypothetical protein
MQTMVNRNVNLPMQTFGCHQIPNHSFKQHGSLHIVMEWGHVSRNVGLQHEIYAHFGQSNVIVARKVEYGKAKYDLSPLGVFM